MTKHKITNNFVCSILYLGINLLFILKYVPRVGNPVFACCAYAVIVALVLLIYNKIYKSDNRFTKISFWFLLGITLTGMFALQHFINPLSLQVDRWSAIHGFFNELFSGNYPYLARTHLGGYGSPFPVWQFFHLPFYLMGNISLAAVFSVIVLLTTVYIYTLSSRKTLFFLVLLFISPAFWYEITVRSDLMYNFFILLAVLLFLLKKQTNFAKHPYLSGILCGLFLSTRFTVIIPFIVLLFADFWQSSLKTKIIFALTTVFVFAFTFSPFIFWNFNSLMFFQYNPFILQTRQGSVFEVLIIFALSIFLSFRAGKNHDKFFCYSAYLLIALVVTTFLHNMILNGFQYGLFSPAYDITYFNMALPFIILVQSLKFVKSGVEP